MGKNKKEDEKEEGKGKSIIDIASKNLINYQ